MAVYLQPLEVEVEIRLWEQKKTTDFLEKTTWTLVIALIILSLATNYIAISKSKKSNPIKGIENTLPATNNQSQSAQ